MLGFSLDALFEKLANAEIIIANVFAMAHTNNTQKKFKLSLEWEWIA